MCTSVDPVDTTGNILVDFGAVFEIWVFGIGVRDGMDGIATVVGCHVRSSVGLVNTKALTSEFGEGRLVQMDGEVVINMMSPGEGSTEEVVNATHEVNLKFGLR